MPGDMGDALVSDMNLAITSNYADQDCWYFQSLVSQRLPIHHTWVNMEGILWPCKSHWWGLKFTYFNYKIPLLALFKFNL